MSEIYGLNAFSPAEVSQKIREVGVTKASLPFVSMSMLGVLAGAFIGLGAMVLVLVNADPDLGFASSQLLSGLVFSLGLVLVIVAGAELFTGNNLLAMAWADGSISTKALLRNWCIVCLANLIGSVGLALPVKYFGVSTIAADAVAIGNFVANLVPVILGNLVGGSVLVALVYHVIYLRQPAD